GRGLASGELLPGCFVQRIAVSGGDARILLLAERRRAATPTVGAAARDRDERDAVGWAARGVRAAVCAGDRRGVASRARGLDVSACGRSGRAGAGRDRGLPAKTLGRSRKAGTLGAGR